LDRGPQYLDGAGRIALCQREQPKDTEAADLVADLVDGPRRVQALRGETVRTRGVAGERGDQRIDVADLWQERGLRRPFDDVTAGCRRVRGRVQAGRVAFQLRQMEQERWKGALTPFAGDLFTRQRDRRPSRLQVSGGLEPPDP